MEIVLISIGFLLGLTFNYLRFKNRQLKFDAKVFEDGVSRGIRVAKMAHTQILRHPHSDSVVTNLYCPAIFNYPDFKSLKGAE